MSCSKDASHSGTSGQRPAKMPAFVSGISSNLGEDQMGSLLGMGSLKVRKKNKSSSSRAEDETQIKYTTTWMSDKCVCIVELRPDEKNVVMH